MKCLTCFNCFGGGEDGRTSAGQADMESKANPEGVALLDRPAAATARATGAEGYTPMADTDAHALHRVDALPHAVHDKPHIPLDTPPQSTAASHKSSSLSSDGVPGKLLTHWPQQQLQERHGRDQQQQQGSGEPRVKLGLARRLPSGEVKPDATAEDVTAAVASDGGGATSRQRTSMEPDAAATPSTTAAAAAPADAPRRSAQRDQQVPVTTAAAAAAGGPSRGPVAQETPAEIQGEPVFAAAEIQGPLAAMPAETPAAAAPELPQGAAPGLRPAAVVASHGTGSGQQQFLDAAGTDATAAGSETNADSIAAALAHINAAAAVRAEDCQRRLAQHRQSAAAAAAGPETLTAVPTATALSSMPTGQTTAADHPHATSATLAAIGQNECDVMASRGMARQPHPSEAAVDQATRSARTDQMPGHWSAAAAAKLETARSAEVEEITYDAQTQPTAEGIAAGTHVSTSKPKQQVPLAQQLKMLPRRAAQTLELWTAQIVIQSTAFLLWCLDHGNMQLDKLPLPLASADTGSSSSRQRDKVDPRRMIRTLPGRSVRILDSTGSQIVVLITGLLLSGINQAMSAFNSLPLPNHSSSSSSSGADLDLQQRLRTLPGKAAKTLDLAACRTTVAVTRSLLILLGLAPVWAQDICQALPGWLAAAAAAVAETSKVLLEVLGPGEESTRILDQSICVTRSLISGEWDVEEPPPAAASTHAPSAAAAAAEGQFPLKESEVIAITEGSGDWLLIDPGQQRTTAAAAAAGSPRTQSGAIPMSSLSAAAAAASNSTWELVKQAVPGAGDGSSSRIRSGTPVIPHPSPCPSITSPAQAAAAAAERGRESHQPAVAPAAGPGAASSSAIEIRSHKASVGPESYLYRTPSRGSSSSSSTPITPRPTPSTSATAAVVTGLQRRQPSQRELRDAVTAAVTADDDASVISSSSSSSDTDFTRSPAEGQSAEIAAGNLELQQQQQRCYVPVPRHAGTSPGVTDPAAAATATAVVDRGFRDSVLLQQGAGHAGLQQQQQQHFTQAPAQVDMREMLSNSSGVGLADIRPMAPAAAAPAAVARLPVSAVAHEGSSSHGKGDITEDWQDISQVTDNQRQQQQQDLPIGHADQQQVPADKPVNTVVQEAQLYTSRLLQLLSSGRSRGSDSQVAGLEQQQQQQQEH